MTNGVITNKPKKILEVTLNKKMGKEKKCLRCGDCCRAETMFRTLSLKEKIIAYLLRPRYIFNRKIECPALSFNSKGLAYCRQYSKRPQFCRDYFCEKGKRYRFWSIADNYGGSFVWLCIPPDKKYIPSWYPKGALVKRHEQEILPPSGHWLKPEYESIVYNQ